MFAAATVALAAPATAEAAAKGKMTVRSQITSFSAVRGGLVANGTLEGSFSAGGETLSDSARVRFRIMQRRPGRCDVLALSLAPLTLELLGVRVQTSQFICSCTPAAAGYSATSSVPRRTRGFAYRGSLPR